MTPREIIALAVGILLGVLLQRPAHAKDCQCSPCARGRWRAGEDPGLPPTKPHTCMSAPKPYPDRLAQLVEGERGCVPPIAKANPAATNIGH